jgi:hypothetical protein
MCRMSLRILLLGSLLLAFTACQSSSISPTDYAQQWLGSKGKKDVKVTKVVAGNPKRYKADELYCVETNATTAANQAYLIAIWRTDSTWSGIEMTNGEYEWDLNGCPRH